MFRETESNKANKYTQFGKEKNGGEWGRRPISSGS